VEKTAEFDHTVTTDTGKRVNIHVNVYIQSTYDSTIVIIEFVNRNYPDITNIELKLRFYGSAVVAAYGKEFTDTLLIQDSNSYSLSIPSSVLGDVCYDIVSAREVVTVAKMELLGIYVSWGNAVGPVLVHDGEKQVAFPVIAADYGRFDSIRVTARAKLDIPKESLGGTIISGWAPYYPPCEVGRAPIEAEWAGKTVEVEFLLGYCGTRTWTMYDVFKDKIGINFELRETFDLVSVWSPFGPYRGCYHRENGKLVEGAASATVTKEADAVLCQTFGGALYINGKPVKCGDEYIPISLKPGDTIECRCAHTPADEMVYDSCVVRTYRANYSKEPTASLYCRFITSINIGGVASESSPLDVEIKLYVAPSVEWAVKYCDWLKARGVNAFVLQPTWTVTGECPCTEIKRVAPTGNESIDDAIYRFIDYRAWAITQDEYEMYTRCIEMLKAAKEAGARTVKDAAPWCYE